MTNQPANSTDSTASVPRGTRLLRDPLLNKGTAFTPAEREALGLKGLLPPHVSTLEQQVTRIMENFDRKESALEKYIQLISLMDRNQTLFYRVLSEYPEEMTPIIYTPTVGQACQEYGQIFRRSHGVYITPEDRGSMVDILKNWDYSDVRVIVVTDGERILGLGDLGSNGMGIPVGKLSLYTACAGISPEACLPITLDVGTNNPSLIDDPLYLGLRQERLRGAEYDDFIEEFIQATQEVYPNVLVQLEDFANANAFRLLAKYQDRICTFDDDIQGTGSVALAGVLSAMRITGQKMADQKILLLGAGQAALGIGGQLATAFEAEGMSREDACERCWFFDSRGLVVAGRDGITEQKAPYAHTHDPETDLLAAIEAVKPSVLIGAVGQGGAFTEAMVRKMAELNERPVIFALSNPTSKAECTAEQAYGWTEGRAVFASGSPFDAVELNGQTFVPGQGNNAYIFPGVGLGVVAVESTRVTDEMFYVAARTLANLVEQEDLDRGRVFPALAKIREVSVAIAVAVAELAYERGFAKMERPEDLEGHIRSAMYTPDYPSYA